jgi:hypothetical protein
MSKKEIKNNHAENNVFGDPSSYSWGRNIWDWKLSIFGLVMITLVSVIVFYADRKGLIDWQEQAQDPWEVQNPHLEQKSDTLK